MSERTTVSDRFLLDTSVLIDSGRLPTGSAEFTDAVYAISAASLAELHFGVLVAPSPDQQSLRLARLAQIERQFNALPIDDRIARAHGRLASAVVAQGRQPRRRVLDLLIAATALTHEATLLTLNLDDFHGLGDMVRVRLPHDV